MDTINPPDEMMRAVRDATSQTIGQQMSKVLAGSTVDKINDIVKQQARTYFDRGFNEEGIAFEVDSNDNTSIVPSNLYTLLLMKGIRVKYEDVKGKNVYTFENGATIEFRGHGEAIFRPVTPLRWIEVTFTLPATNLLMRLKDMLKIKVKRLK